MRQKELRSLIREEIKRQLDEGKFDMLDIGDKDDVDAFSEAIVEVDYAYQQLKKTVAYKKNPVIKKLGSQLLDIVKQLDMAVKANT